MNNANLYIDLDGVMADFDKHFPILFGTNHNDLEDDVMWKHINSHPSFFLDLPVCEGAIDFFNSVKHLNPTILTACPKSNYKLAAVQKRQWVRKHISTNITVIPMMGGKNKGLFMHNVGDVLIDDFEKNCKAWAELGGFPILHKNFTDTSKTLKDLGFDV